ncbi:hypothetical protein FDENT_4081 [Fusarium denticulatum]|uniref:F-box domain-containing protein n=1 Tax=Fusarium denticulatum TaxID=48507 RepID=A0A8H5UJF8_9HYPO|nr:hypothetical protein FDENT_4081 [Fusarium denticulatum]
MPILDSRPRSVRPIWFLNNLPVEIQQGIAHFVDPIGLISLRQTNRRFRDIINVQRQQYVERLLALECTQEHGGPPIIFTTWRDKPAWFNQNLAEARWACTGCMRLRPYHHFQYKFLAEVIWRKPMPGNPDTNVITSWEPSSTGIGGAQITPSADGGRSLQARYRAIVEDFSKRDALSLLGCYQFHQVGNMAGYTVHDLRQMILHNPEALRWRLRQSMITMENSGDFGSDRYFRSQDGLYGTENFPIISIENHNIASPIDRYFPGILENSRQGRPPTRFHSCCLKLWPLWMARCPRCAKWKELRAFRIGADEWREPDSWQPAVGRLTWDGVILTREVFENACCNECFMVQKGWPALAEYHGRWFQFLVEQQPADVQAELFNVIETLVAKSGVLLNSSRATEWT